MQRLFSYYGPAEGESKGKERTNTCTKKPHAWRAPSRSHFREKTDLITQYEYRLGLCNCTFVIKLSTVIQTSHEDICIHT